MDQTADTNYRRIAEAIYFIQQNFKQQPDLDAIADRMNLSPFHFQKLFTEWAGVSPKKFLQFISLQNAKELLRGQQQTLSEAAFYTGLSGTGRLHDLFISIEGMTPYEFKNGGKDLQINYNIAASPFGEILVASTAKGVCHLSFIDDGEQMLARLREDFPNATLINTKDEIQEAAAAFFRQDWNSMPSVKLHLKASPFQLKVWEALLKIPAGQLSTYGQIAASIENPKASRAVGTAIGSNPIAFLIPCHRVIQASGLFGGYMWGPARKTAIIGWEAAKR